jgi:hypothetical protein
MKQVVYTDRAKQDPKEYAALQAVTEALEQVAARSGETVIAEWDRTTDTKGRTVYVLRLSDWSGSASAIFAPHDLNLTNLLWARLYSVWGDLLQNRSHRLSEERVSAAAGGEQ